MKTGLVIKSTELCATDDEMLLINRYTRRELTKDEVYIFSVVLCDNDVDRDYERFTVESLFALQNMFVGKTGIFDHTPSARNQTARIFDCEVEAVEGRKTVTGDDYFRLKAKAYIPKSDKNADVILSLDSGIIKEVSVGCAVKQTVCSICSNDINSASCTHCRGVEYGGKLCYGEMIQPLDAYEFSFVAVPAQKNAGVIKSYTQKKESTTMKEILEKVNKHKELSLKASECEGLSAYIEKLEAEACDGRAYRESVKKSLLGYMSVYESVVPLDTLKSIVDKLSIEEMKALGAFYVKKEAHGEYAEPQLNCYKCSEHSNHNNNNHFTI